MRRFRVRKWANATLWRCQESTCSPSSHKSFAPQNLCGSPERGSSHHLLASLPEGGAARPHVRARGGRLFLDFSGSFPIKAVLFFRQNPQAPFFPLPENRFFLSRRRGRRSMREKGRGAPKKTSPPRTTGSGNNKFARRREKGRAPPKKTSPPRQAKGAAQSPPPKTTKKQLLRAAARRRDLFAKFSCDRGGPFRHFSA